MEDVARGLQYLHDTDLAHGNLKGVRFLRIFSNDDTHWLVQKNILISDDGCACIADVGLTRIAPDMVSVTAGSMTDDNSNCSSRWGAPELLDPERFGSKRRGPTKKSDIHSMGMTIYEVSFLQRKSGGSIEVALGSHGQHPILRVQ